MKFKYAKFVLCISGLVVTPSGYAQSHSSPAPYSCSIYEVSLEGTWQASRKIVDPDGSATATRDTYEWQPTEILTFGPGMKLRWERVFYWPTAIGQQDKISETDIMIDMHFAFDANNGEIFKKPERSWLHLYRTSNTEKDKHVLATSLSTMMLWHQYGPQKLSTRAILSLDDLLAFGTGREVLSWDIRSQPDMYGATKVMASGSLPIAAMRAKPADIPKLRKQLNEKAADFRKHCNNFLAANSIPAP